MPTFAYTALDRQGRQTSGTVPADSRASAMDAVLDRGLSPVSIEEKGANGKTGVLDYRGNGVQADVGQKPPSTTVSAARGRTFTREIGQPARCGLVAVAGAAPAAS
jgi:type II secretory pathway component PulF